MCYSNKNLFSLSIVFKRFQKKLYLQKKESFCYSRCNFDANLDAKIDGTLKY